MQYYQQPDQDFGGGGYDADPEQQAKKRKPAQRNVTGAAPGMERAAAAIPQTFSQMQKLGLARPPMPSAQPARLSPRINPMNNPVETAQLSPRINPMTPTGGAALMQESPTMAPGGSMITTTASPDGSSPWGPMTPGAQPSGAPAGNAPPNFDPMEWFRQQVMGGSQNVLERSQNYLGGQIDDEYDVREQRLREEMASRGLADSTVYGGRMQDLNVGRRSAKSDLGERLALEDLQRRTGMVDRMVGMDENTRNYLLQLLGFGYGG